MICVRENSEGGKLRGRRPDPPRHGARVAQQVGVFTRHGIERILRYS
jgi:isocitrate/isopropylmalate dehydrogenase